MTKYEEKFLIECNEVKRIIDEEVSALRAEMERKQARPPFFGKVKFYEETTNHYIHLINSKGEKYRDMIMEVHKKFFPDSDDAYCTVRAYYNRLLDEYYS